ncbi:hypothetical protein [Mannheimia indoligenes]|uniref:hypothetical protein n=1 Tax=Mannheimia indoligenes TaxID=3103145 RepID=UPI002FE6669A
MRNSIYFQNKHLQNNCGLSSIFGTTTKIGNRSRYSSGIFLPQIYQSHGLATPENYSKFAVRATPRNKADSLRTNKGGCILAVVEPLSHLSFLCDKPLNPNKGDHAMTTKTKIANRKRNLAVFSPLFILLSDAIKGGFYA